MPLQATLLCVALCATGCSAGRLLLAHGVRSSLRPALLGQNGTSPARHGSSKTLEPPKPDKSLQLTTWPRNAWVYDKSLQFTFRGSDFLPEGTDWSSKPRVNRCADSSKLPHAAEHVCDLLELRFKIASPGGALGPYFFGRDYVAPLPNQEQVDRMRDGPFTGLVQGKVQRLTFVVHGYIAWTAKGIGEWEAKLASQLVTTNSGGDVAVIINWIRGAHATWEDCHGTECLDDYPVAMADARVVGKYIQRLAATAREVLGDVKFGCIGHSVGSHVCGFAGKYMGLEELPGGKMRMSRISSLDPAGPSHSLVAAVHALMGGRSFVNAGYRFARLNRNDADFVDVYISDPGGYGYDITLAAEYEGRGKVDSSDMLGHVTFLVNGQSYEQKSDMQPGCEDKSIKLGCSHHVAIDAYIQTLAFRGQDKPAQDQSSADKKTLGLAAVRHKRASEGHARAQDSAGSRAWWYYVLFAIIIAGAACGAYYIMLSSFALALRIIGIAIFLFVCIFALLVVHNWPQGATSGSEAIRTAIRDASADVSKALSPRNWLPMGAEQDPADYCLGAESAKPMDHCEFPFSVNEGGSGSSCPKYRRIDNITFGICAGPRDPEGLYLVPIAELEARQHLLPMMLNKKKRRDVSVA